MITEGQELIEDCDFFEENGEINLGFCKNCHKAHEGEDGYIGCKCNKNNITEIEYSIYTKPCFGGEVTKVHRDGFTIFKEENE